MNATTQVELFNTLFNQTNVDEGKWSKLLCIFDSHLLFSLAACEQHTPQLQRCNPPVGKHLHILTCLCLIIHKTNQNKQHTVCLVATPCSTIYQLSSANTTSAVQSCWYVYFW